LAICAGSNQSRKRQKLISSAPIGFAHREPQTRQDKFAVFRIAKVSDVTGALGIAAAVPRGSLGAAHRWNATWIQGSIGCTDPG
jgi:hypothetical protein